MKRLLIFPISALCFGCLPLQEANVIQVEGKAAIEATPDMFQVSASVETLETSREDALANIAAIYSSLNETLPNLEGLERLNVETSNVGILPNYEDECQRARYDDSKCPIIGYSASIGILITGAPARSAGNMVSMVSELGATSINFEGFLISNEKDFQEDAVTAAVEKARRSAEQIAAAAGASVVGVKKIQLGRDFENQNIDYNSDTIIVTGSRLYSPKTPLDIEPQPITIEAEVVAAFEIE